MTYRERRLARAERLREYASRARDSCGGTDGTTHPAAGEDQ